MKRFLLWIISVALGVALLLAAVMGVSYAFTTQGGDLSFLVYLL